MEVGRTSQIAKTAAAGETVRVGFHTALRHLAHCRPESDAQYSPFIRLLLAARLHMFLLSVV